MDIFVASSSQGAGDLETVCDLLAKAGLTPKPWNSPGMFPQGVSTLESLGEIASSVQGAAFVFREDDRTKRAAKKNSDATTRDNVVLEYGLFAGKLSPRQCAIFLAGKTSPPSDLKGITYISLADLTRAREETLAWAADLSHSKSMDWPTPLDRANFAVIMSALKAADVREIALIEIAFRLGYGPQAVEEAPDYGAPVQPNVNAHD